MYNILICDDQPDIVNALKIYLKPEGYKLFEAFTGEQALVAYTLILAINRPIEMLVTSLNCVGDSLAAIAVSKSEGKLDEQIFNN